MDNVCRIPLTRGQFALIDSDDYARVSPFRWLAMPTPTSGGSYYAAANVKDADGRRRTIYMHRLIANAPTGKEVDHVNHETLDNRRSNLRLGSHLDNMRNGKNALATHCPKGHPYDESNTLRRKRTHGRQCLACAREWNRAALTKETPEQREARRRRAAANYARNKEKRGVQQKAWAAANRVAINARTRAWWKARRQKSEFLN